MDVEKVVDRLLASISFQLRKGNRVVLKDFGFFEHRISRGGAHYDFVRKESVRSDAIIDRVFFKPEFTIERTDDHAG